MGNDVTNPRAFRARAKLLLQEVLHIPSQIINQQLGHAIKDRKECDSNCGSCLLERRKMMQLWSDYVERLMIPDVNP
jgi:hypothetical protein